MVIQGKNASPSSSDNMSNEDSNITDNASVKSVG